MTPPDNDRQPIGKTHFDTRGTWADESGSNELPAPESSANPLVGQTFAAKYQVLSALGEGGMSVVYLVRHLGLAKLMALKMLHTHLASRGTSQLRFQQEARAASQLAHPGIIMVHDYGITDDGVPYLVMDYIEGESLANLLAKQTRLDLCDALPIFLQTCSALAHAHEHGLIHRDLKPSNIMLRHQVDDSLQVLVVDFGVAKLVGESSPNVGKLTQTGEFVGSPFYMSPEQCQGKKLDTRTDIYSMGCVMYETLLGRVPFEGESIYAILSQHMSEMPPSLSSIRPELAKVPLLEKVLFKALAKDPSARYQSMTELASDLSLIQSGHSAHFFKRIADSFELLKVKGQATAMAVGTVAMLLVMGLIAVLIADPRLALQPLDLYPAATVRHAHIWPKYPPPWEPGTAENTAFGLAEAACKAALADDLKRYQNPRQPQKIADSYAKACRFYLHYGKYKEAEGPCLKAIEALTQCADKQAEPCLEKSTRETDLRTYYLYLAECTYRLSQYKESIAFCSEYSKLSDKIKSEREWHYGMQKENTLYAKLIMADCYYRTGMFTQAYQILSAPGFYKDVEMQLPEQTALYKIEYAETARCRQKYVAAAQVYTQAKELWENARKEHQTLVLGGLGDNQEYQILVLCGLADCLAAQGELLEANSQYAGAMQIIDKMPASDAANQEIASVVQAYSNFLITHSSFLHDQANFFKALKLYEQAKYLRHA